MSNPFLDIDTAFLPMFTDSIQVICSRDNGKIDRATVMACVFPQERIEPFVDSSTESDLRIINIVVPRNDWPFNDLMRIGDKVKQEDNRLWKITDVQLHQNMITLVARSGKR